ncbi:MAG: DUF3349 domain-containing protein [Rhodococcus sp.]|nr:DUF3349 domain-containing protein [Rhodococcus sp. (in: high G+C Gram-positive bacteria)]
MAKYSVRSILDWLRAGYPEGIPHKDQIAVLEVLRRRLTAEEISQVVDLAIETADEAPGHVVDFDRVRSIISSVILEEPSERDLLRVTETLTAAGWPVAAEWDESSEHTG